MQNATYLSPLLNDVTPPSGRMLQVLAIFEGMCRIDEINRVTEADVKKFIAEYDSPELADSFKASYLSACRQ